MRAIQTTLKAAVRDGVIAGRASLSLLSIHGQFQSNGGRRA